MPIEPGSYVDVGRAGRRLTWKRPKGEPKGVTEAVLHRHRDGSYSHLLRIERGVEFPEPIAHDFHEEVYYLRGTMLNTKTQERITSGTYVYHRPGERHGPLRCLATCLVLEFRYYR